MNSFRQALKKGFLVRKARAGYRYIPCHQGFIKAENGKWVAMLGAYSVAAARVKSLSPGSVEDLGGIIAATFDDLSVALKLCSPKRVPRELDMLGFYRKTERYYGDTKAGRILCGTDR
jgi:hypothetical protein